MRRRAALATLAGLGAALAGCASPNPELFTLGSIPGQPVRATARSLELRRIGLAGYLDRPGIMRSPAPYRYKVLDNERWAEPLGGMVGRVLTEDLVARLPGVAVFAESGAISTRPDLALEIDVQRFDADEQNTVVLLVQIAIRHEASDQPVSATAETIRLAAQAPSGSTQDLVATMSVLLGQFADRIAARL